MLCLAQVMEFRKKFLICNCLGSSHQQFIKRPLNAYMIWTRQERRKILTGDPKLKMNEVSKAVCI